MFDYTKLSETFDLAQISKTAETTVDSMVDTAENTAKKFNSYITDAKAKTVAEAIAEAQFATIRSAISNFRLAAKTFSA